MSAASATIIALAAPRCYPPISGYYFQKSWSMTMTSPVLGFDLKTVREASALDIFAMPVPLSAKGEKLWDDAMVQIEQDRKNPAFNRGRKFTL